MREARNGTDSISLLDEMFASVEKYFLQVSSPHAIQDCEQNMFLVFFLHAMAARPPKVYIKAGVVRNAPKNL